MVAGNLIKQQLANLLSLLVCLVGNNAESRGDISRGVAVAESYYSHILRDVQVKFLDGVESGIGYDVVKSEYGVWPVFAHQQLLGRCLCHIIVNLSASHQSAVYWYAVLLQSLQISVFPATYHIKMVWTSEEGYSLASVVYEMLSRLLSRLVAVSHNAREEFWQACTGEENQRDAHVVKFPEMGVVNGILRQAGYDALNVHAHEIVYSELLTVVVLVAVSANYRVT